MRPSYRIAELEKTVDAFRQRAFEAERERDEMKGSLKAAAVNAETWMKRALKAEMEIARRDAAAGEPVGLVEFSDYMTAEELAGMKPRRVAVKELLEGALKVGDHLYTAAPPAVLPAEACEPDGYIFCHLSGKNFWSVSHPDNAGHNGVKPFYFASPPAVLPPPLDNWHNSASGVMQKLQFKGDELSFTAGANWMRQQCSELGAQPQKPVALVGDAVVYEHVKSLAQYGTLPNGAKVTAQFAAGFNYRGEIDKSALDAANVPYGVKK